VPFRTSQKQIIANSQLYAQEDVLGYIV